tara:strand:+ start:177 stop:896 length:720 start_codon:yes stop_codon:yes gene_type:complete
MNAIIRNIPNYITISNLACGTLSIIFTFNNQLNLAALLIFIGVFLDFFDGFFARILKVENALGIQLDSMADLITSGIAPSFILFKLININEPNLNVDNLELPFSILSLTAFFIVIFAALRLAKFNIDTSQKNSFTGLPTPMTAIFIASLPLIESSTLVQIFNNTILLCIISLTLSLLMVSKLKFFTIKLNFEKNVLNQLNAIQLCMLISSLILLFIFHLGALPFIVVLYVLLSIINNII